MQQTQGFRTLEHDGVYAERRLRSMSLSMDGIILVIKQGEDARAHATRNDPLNAPALDAWRYRVRGLRDTYCTPHFKWTIDREQGLEGIRSECGQRSVVTRAGHKGVGIRGMHPQPKNEIGDVTAKRVSTNGSLLLDPAWMNTGKIAVSGSDLWMLLVQREGDNVAAELSLASAIADDGSVEGWIERVLLPGFDMSEPGKALSPSTEMVEIQKVPIVRKQRR